MDALLRGEGEAPLITQMKKISDSTLYVVENFLYYTTISAGPSSYLLLSSLELSDAKVYEP